MATRATGGAQIHDGLRIVGKAILRRVVLSKGPQPITDRPLTRPTFYRVVSRQYPLDVAVENWRAGIHCQRQNCTGGGSPNTGQSLEPCKIAGENTVERCADLLGAPVQVTRTRVVAEACPQMQHGVLGGVSEVFNCGELGHEALVKGNHRADLSLLEHDL